MQLSDEFETLDLDQIRRYVATRQEEHLSLEFKRAVSCDLTNAADQRNFATALAGFANADGGLLVWGVGTVRRGRAEIADTESPIANIGTFIGRLNEFTSVLANPRVEGVRHRKIELLDGSGFAVSFIPASDGGPHMAKAGINQYMRRHGDRFQVMEHYEVADMFGRRPRAKLAINWSILDSGATNTERFVRIQLQLRNVGRAPASAPYLSIAIDQIGARINPTGLSRFSANEEALLRRASMRDGSVAFFGARGLMLPPGPAFDAVIVVLAFPRGAGAVARQIRCGIAAENSGYEEITIDLAEHELAQVLPTTP